MLFNTLITKEILIMFHKFAMSLHMKCQQVSKFWF